MGNESWPGETRWERRSRLSKEGHRIIERKNEGWNKMEGAQQYALSSCAAEMYPSRSPAASCTLSNPL